jgi:hypothetical protein
MCLLFSVYEITLSQTFEYENDCESQIEKAVETTWLYWRWKSWQTSSNTHTLRDEVRTKHLSDSKQLLIIQLWAYDVVLSQFKGFNITAVWF